MESLITSYDTFPQNSIPSPIVKSVFKRLSHNSFNIFYYSDGSTKTLPDAKFGNAAYGWRSHIKAIALQEKMNALYHSDGLHQSNCTYETLTVPYEKSSSTGTLDAIERVKKAFPKYIRMKRKQGLVEFIACFECHKAGGCHVHLICVYDHQLQFYKDRTGKLRHGSLNDKSHDLWKICLNGKGHVDLQGMESPEACGYILKELTKAYSCEKALKRIENGEELEKNDANRIWLTWAVDKTRMRTLQKSKGFALTEEDLEEVKEAEASRLDSEKTNSTEEKPEIVATLNFSSFQVQNLDWFKIWTGKVDPESRMYRELWALCPLDRATIDRLLGRSAS